MTRIELSEKTAHLLSYLAMNEGVDEADLVERLIQDHAIAEMARKVDGGSE